MDNICVSRLAALRAAMKANGIDTYLIPTADYHGSEYVADFFRAREYFSGFTGSAGTLIVRKKEAGLWTDGRYYIQAEKELAGSGITLYRMGEEGVPTILQFLKDHMPADSVLGFDGRCITKKEGERYRRELNKRSISINASLDLPEKVWKDRPALPSHPVFLLDEKYAGESAKSKLARLRAAMELNGAAYYVSGKLDEIMWLYNIRGNDVECNPVALSYTFVTRNGQCLFIQDGEVTEELRAYARTIDLNLHDYCEFENFLSDFPFRSKVMIDPECISYAAFLKIQDSMQRMSCADRGGNFIECASPIERMKAIKNETEIRNMKEAYLEDSAKLTQFLYWLKKNAAAGSAEPAGAANPPAESAATAPAAPAAPITEASAAAYLDGLRAEISDFVELSFPTISAYGENAAMMHYEPGADGGAILKPEGMYLVDSGGQYLRGTTDVTRTIALGPVTEDMKKSYTLTAVSQLQLMGLTFLYGCSGLALDVIARSPLWAEGIDYKCGTGHGIGYLLNVHEGPQSFRYRKRSDGEDTPMEAGMVISDEPGVYKEGRYGIRIETILLTVPKMETEDGKFLGFEPLTFVPLDPELIDPKYLTPKTRDLLNAYHKEVCEKITPLLPTEEERAWLKEQCKEI